MQSLSGNDGDMVQGLESFISCTVLIDADSKVKPGFQISI